MAPPGPTGTSAPHKGRSRRDERSKRNASDTVVSPQNRMGSRFLGLVIVLVTIWRALALLVTSLRYWLAPSFWLEVGTNLPIWVLCWISGFALLQGRRSGFRPLYAVTVLFLASSFIGYFLPQIAWARFLRLGRTPRAGLVSVAVLALLGLAHWASARWLPTEPARTKQNLCLRLGLFLALCLLYVGCCYGFQQTELEAGKVVHRGNLAYEEGRHEDAFQDWGRVIDGYPYTSAWGVAVFNLGHCLRERLQYHEAIARLETLLSSSLDDHDPSGRLMEAYQNYHHLACLEISECYAGLKDYPAALRYAVLARDTYPYRSWCGTCCWSAAEQLRQRIEQLEQCCDQGK